MPIPREPKKLSESPLQYPSISVESNTINSIAIGQNCFDERLYISGSSGLGPSENLNRTHWKILISMLDLHL